ncbi:hypothetical protein OG535_18155 [Kitasatospora sp. NBC_00085]|uniref:hypothetical protein n=1 Tax=Kitasatospora sp. NBC_00085 TaxID=2903566 RepID=UPI00324EBEB9
MSDADPHADNSDVDLSAEIPSPTFEGPAVTPAQAPVAAQAATATAEPEDLKKELPSSKEAAEPKVVLEETTFKLGDKISFGSKTLPGSVVNRVSGWAVMIMIATVAAYATAGVCKLGSTTGDVVTAIGLASFVGVLAFGLWWVTQDPSKPRRTGRTRRGTGGDG